MANAIQAVALLAASSLLIITGCAASPEVVPIGNGRYRVTGLETGRLNAGQDTMQPAKAAKAYCAKQSKRMVIREIENVSITFTCE